MPSDVTEKPKAVAYLRVSTAGQVEDGMGLDIQEQAVRRCCETAGFEVVAVFSDEGVSGAKDVAERPALAHALTVLDHSASVLVVAKLDRLARAFTVQEAVLAQAWRSGARVYAADLGEVLKDDPDDPMRTAMRQMVGVFSQLERAMIAARMAGGRRFKAGRGGYAGYGSPRFGQRAEGKELVADVAEQRVIARIVELRSQQVPLRAIAARLDEEGLRSKRGGPWHTETVRRILQRVDAAKEAEIAAKVSAVHYESQRHAA